MVWAKYCIKALCFAQLLLCVSVAEASFEKPRHVVSISLCTDQFLVQLAEREQIAGVSFLARDPDSSYVAGEIGDLPIVHDAAETILPLKPDLVLASAYSSPLTVNLLRDNGVRVERIGLPQTTDEIISTTLKVASLLGETQKAKQLLKGLRNEMRIISDSPAIERPLAVIFQPKGYTFGAGTLENEIIERTGYVNLAAIVGIEGHGFISLERLVHHRPAIMIQSRSVNKGQSQASELFNHPAIERSKWHYRRIEIPAALWSCSGIMTAELIRRLRQGRGQ